MKWIQITLLTTILLLTFSDAAFAQKRGERVRAKVTNSPKAKIASKLLQIVVRETLETVAAKKDTLTNFPCATLKVDEVKETATIDFGESCQGKGKHLHSGIIIIHYNNKQQNNNQRVAIELVDYKIDNRLIDGIGFLEINPNTEDN